MKGFLDKYIEGWKDDPEYQAEYLILEIIDNICERMKEKNVSKEELARRLGKSKAYVTRLLDGNVNITLLKLVKVFLALKNKQ